MKDFPAPKTGTEDTRVELLDGEIVWMSPMNDPHAACAKRLNHLFSRRYVDLALVSVQDPIRIEHYDEPQPGVALLTPRPDFYASATPTPADLLLLVEVANTTLRIDLGRKARIHASGRVRVLGRGSQQPHALRASLTSGR